MAAYRLLSENAAVRARYRAQFRHILVDEVQDTSGAQMRLIAALAADDMANVSVIGDGKQSIYGWRGARPENLTAFAPLSDGGAEQTLRRNYRSHQELLDVAAHALRPLEGQGRVTSAELDLAAERLTAGRAVVTVAAPSRPFRSTGRGETKRPTWPRASPRCRRKAYRGEEIVILMRSVAQAGLYDDALRERGIPTLVVGGKGFFGRPEVRDALALLRAAADLLDSAALVRVMQGPLCGLSDAAVAAIARHGGHGQLYEGLARAETLPFSVHERDEVVRRCAALVALLGRVGRRLEGLPLPDLLQRRAGGERLPRLRAHAARTCERERMLANLEKLCRAARLYAEAHPLDTVAAFARQLSYMFDEAIEEAEESVDAGPDVVRIMTVHQAKGLEFPVVVVVNAMPRPHRQRDEAAMTYEEDEGFVLLRRRDPHTLELRDAADSAGYKGARRGAARRTATSGTWR